MFLKAILAFLSKIFLFTGKLGPTRTLNFEKKLAPEKEKELFNRIKIARQIGRSDPEAEEIITKHNLRLVAHIAKKYKSTFSDSDDLISIGSIGLIKAVRTFDQDKVKHFSSYASRCIENEMLMVLRHEKKFSAEISMESSLGTDSDGNELTIADTLYDEKFDLEQLTDNKTILSKIKKIAKDSLDEREYQIIVRRFGLNGNIPETQHVVAKNLGISRSYISRLESIAIQKLKTNLNK